MIDDDDSPRVSTPLAQRLADLGGTPVTIAVWLVAAGTVTWLLAGRVATTQYVGIARAIRYELSPTRTGTVAAIAVDLHDAVEPEAVVATLDGADVRARLATAEAVLVEIDARFEHARTRVRRGADPSSLDWRADLERFEVDAAQRRIDLLEVDVDIETDRIEAQRLALARERSVALFEDGMISDAERDEAVLQHEATLARIEANVALRTHLETEHASALARLRDFQGRVPADAAGDRALAPLVAAVEVQRRRIDELRGERERLVLRAPIGGRVTEVLARAGQAVVAGEPVVMISPRFASEVVGFLPEGDQRAVGELSTVVLARADDPTTVAESFVLRLSAAVEVLPERLWARPGVPDYGRAFVVADAQALSLLPGERVIISPRASR